MSNKSKLQGSIVLKHFKLTKRLGTGAFGQVYLAVNTNKDNEHYAAKLQESSAKHPQLYFEAKLYRHLNSEGPDRGIPKVYDMTTEGSHNIMLMDLLGQSLEDIFADNNRKFSLKTVLLIADQMLERIEFLHSKEFLHRDIKPDNFLMGVGENSDRLYMIDLGLAKKYLKEGNHIPYKDGKELTGTARYASINTHVGIEQARRDDIESVGYVLMYFLRGVLPWQNMKSKDARTKYAMIKEKKMATTTQALCKGYPEQFATFLNYTKKLGFYDKPDYSDLRKLFAGLGQKNRFCMDGVYDWTRPAKSEQINPSTSIDAMLASNQMECIEQSQDLKRDPKKPEGMSIEKSNTSNYLNANRSKTLTKTKPGSQKVAWLGCHNTLTHKMPSTKR